jgi:hypothetical protein
VTVLGQDENGVDGLRTTIAGVPAGPCGHGCYRAEPARVPGRVLVRLGSTRVSFPIPSSAPAAGALTLRATRVFRGLRSVEFIERLSSGSGASLTTDWVEEAPDRFTYRIHGEGQAIAIGDRRWDRATAAGRWRESTTFALRFPSPLWSRVANARLVGESLRTATIAFYDPSIPAWFTIRVDRRTARTLSAEMIATAHFMHHDYRAWNAAPPIVPPH